MSPLATSLRFLQTQPDARLVALARDGHEAAFEALVRRYRRRLLSYCRRIVGSEAAAEDVLQQALLQAWVALGRGTEVNDARAWLYRIVHNVAISSLRAAVSPAIDLADAEISSEPDREVEQRIAVRAALAGLAALPQLQREVMLSTAVDGRSYDEIATELGLTSGAVRGLLYRARSTLRAAAAALIPAPLIKWAAHSARHTGAQSSRASTLSEAIAGTGSAGVGGVLLKGGAVIASAGALATAVGISTNHPSLRLRPGAGATAVASAAGERSAAGQSAAGHPPASQAGGGTSTVGGRGGTGAGAAGSHGAGASTSRISVTPGVAGGGSGSKGHDGGGSGRSGGDGGGSRGGSDGGSAGSSGGPSGSGGHDGGGTSGGHDGGGSSGGSTPTIGGGSGGGDGSTTAPTSGSGSGGDGSTGSSDSFGGLGSGGSGADTSTTTTATTTSTTTSDSSSSGGGD